MRRTSSSIVIAATLVALGSACGPSAGEPGVGQRADKTGADKTSTGKSAADQFSAGDISQRPRVWPKPTPPPDASPVYHDVKERASTEEDIARAALEYNAKLEASLEEAVRGDDVQRREAAIVFLLPELLQLESSRVVNLLARQKPGPSRDLLLDDIARLWAAKDAPAAVRWIKSLQGEERRKAGVAAVTSLLPFEPDTARRLAVELDLDADRSLRKLLSATQH